MITWGVLRLPAGVDAAADAGDGAVAAGVARHLDGLVAVAWDTPVRDVLATLPATVTHVVELDPATATDPGAGDVLARLLDALDGAHAAVVSARPLADALKRVEDDVVVAGLERDGLLTPDAPAVLDRAAAAEVAEDDPGCDGVAMLLAAGRPVRMVPLDGDPLTVRDGSAR